MCIRIWNWTLYSLKNYVCERTLAAWDQEENYVMDAKIDVETLKICCLEKETMIWRQLAMVKYYFVKPFAYKMASSPISLNSKVHAGSAAMEELHT